MPTFAFSIGNGSYKDSNLFVNVLAEASAPTPRQALEKIVGTPDEDGAVPTHDCWDFAALDKHAKERGVKLYAFFDFDDADYDIKPEYVGPTGKPPGDLVVVPDGGDPVRVSVVDHAAAHADDPAYVARVDALDVGGTLRGPAGRVLRVS